METKTRAKREGILDLNSSGGLRGQIQMNHHVALWLLDAEISNRSPDFNLKTSKKSYFRFKLNVRRQQVAQKNSVGQL